MVASQLPIPRHRYAIVDSVSLRWLWRHGCYFGQKKRGSVSRSTGERWRWRLAESDGCCRCGSYIAHRAPCLLLSIGAVSGHCLGMAALRQNMCVHGADHAMIHNSPDGLVRLIIMTGVTRSRDCRREREREREREKEREREIYCQLSFYVLTVTSMLLLSFPMPLSSTGACQHRPTKLSTGATDPTFHLDSNFLIIRA